MTRTQTEDFTAVLNLPASPAAVSALFTSAAARLLGLLFRRVDILLGEHQDLHQHRHRQPIRLLRT